VHVANGGGSLQFIPVTQTVSTPIPSACWLATHAAWLGADPSLRAYLVPHDRQIMSTVIWVTSL
jgi:hypothetical protein